MDYNYVETCPYCGKQYAAFIKTERNYNEQNWEITNNGTANVYLFDLNDCIQSHTKDELNWVPEKTYYQLLISRCTYCGEEKITIEHFDKREKLLDDKQLIKRIRPKFPVTNFPDYVPLAVRQDYDDANSIVGLCPKAAATLARRALEGMILDCFKIPSKSKGSLKNEIDAIKDLIPSVQFEAIDAVRKIGDIGAHMEKDINLIIDVDKGEAEKLIELINFLINEWYIAPHNEEKLLKTLVSIDKEKQQAKNTSVNNTNDMVNNITNNGIISGDCNMNVGNITITNKS